MLPSNSIDSTLRRRALQVIPGGMWGHMNAANLPDTYPQFFSRAQGSRVWDVDGNEYRDFMCSWGPIILGHRHPEVEAAVQRQLAAGDCMNGPSEAMVELAELLVDTVAHADWAQFQKNGTDATTNCVTIARAATGKRKILKANGAYHGAVPWCSPSLVGVTAEDRAHVLTYEYNDIASLKAAVDACGGDLAGVLVSAFRHDIGRDQELPTPEFARAVRKVCDDAGAVLILDDVRAGFRLHLAGSWEPLGVRPDLAAWSKAIANGYALSAVTGSDALRDAATRVYTTGSFWCSSMSMAAAVATIGVLRRSDVPARLARLGGLLRDGFAGLALQHGTPIRQTGPVQMPMVLFEDDPEYRRGNAFCNAALSRGVYFHPRHNMFLSAAHDEDDIEAALAAAAHGFAAAAAVPILQAREPNA
jgi:glutamate-1-semialdehyde 2,1-aminomutase